MTSISRRNDARAASLIATSDNITLTATVARSRSRAARYTAPMPPRPRSFPSVYPGMTFSRGFFPPARLPRIWCRSPAGSSCSSDWQDSQKWSAGRPGAVPPPSFPPQRAQHGGCGGVSGVPGLAGLLPAGRTDERAADPDAVLPLGVGDGAAAVAAKRGGTHLHDKRSLPHADRVPILEVDLRPLAFGALLWGFALRPPPALDAVDIGAIATAEVSHTNDRRDRFRERSGVARLSGRCRGVARGSRMPGQR